jgi:hypothetical protein
MSMNFGFASNPYTANGFASRAAYLDHLADEYGPAVFAVADVLGASEDFDGLVTTLEDMADAGELSAYDVAA